MDTAMDRIPFSSMSIRQIEQSRKAMHQQIDEQYDQLVASLLLEDKQVEISAGEQVMSLATAPSRFKGLKPVTIIFPEGRSIQTTKWRETILEIMRDCNTNPRMHDRLMHIRDRVSGRFRYVISEDPEKLNVPLKIDEGLYVEGKYDTEYLLKVVTTELLDVVGYDYDRIALVVFDPKQEMTREMSTPVMQI